MLTTHKNFRLSLCVTLAFGLSACGGSDNQAIAPLPLPPPTPAPTLPPDINPITVFDGPLIQTSTLSTEQYIKNGIYANSVSESRFELATPTALGDAGFSSGSDFSVTNTIEQGVDEADRLKYDGTYMYVAEAKNYFLPQNDESPMVRVLARNEDYTLTALPSLQSSLQYEAIDGMYLQEDKLAVIGTNVTVSVFDTNLSGPPPTYNIISVSLFDVSDPTSATESASFQIDGDITDTRRIDNNLFIVSTYYAGVTDLIVGANSDADKLTNFTRVSETPISDLMPKLYKDGQESLLVDPEECFIPQQASEQDGNSELVFITKVNLDNPDEIESLCISTFAGMVYSSVDNLYVLSSNYSDKTIFHKISLTSFDYLASGSVNGLLGWRGNPAFRIDEANNQLRVISSDYTEAEPVHSLSILEQNGSQLQTVAMLPNDQAPEPIGKPREDIYAVRFIDDKAYIVTFERTDPLYVLNLSDSSNPFIEGSLEIPGFSSYIHPLDNNYLLGIGQEVSAATIFPDDLQVAPPPVTTGMKISLFDVRNPSDPLEISSIVTPFAYTPVEYSYKSLSVLNSEGMYQFAFPYEQFARLNENGEQENFSTSRNGLMLLETDTNDSVPRIDLIKELIAPGQDEFFYYTPTDRSIIQGNKVYYIRGNQVFLADWAEDGETLGPF